MDTRLVFGKQIGNRWIWIISIVEYRRRWTVHPWMEEFLEVFAKAAMAFIFTQIERCLRVYELTDAKKEKETP